MLVRMSTEKLRSEVLALPAEERADLAHALLESLHEGGIPTPIPRGSPSLIDAPKPSQMERRSLSTGTKLENASPPD
jgi:hypothetical protein